MITDTNGGDHPLNVEVFIEIASSSMSTYITSIAIISDNNNKSIMVCIENTDH